MMHSTFRARSAATISATGCTTPLGLVTWLTSAKRVRDVTCASSASTICPGSRTGQGNAARTTLAPRAAAARRRLFTHAGYSCAVHSTSSPAPNGRLASAVATPTVALGTKTRSSGAHPAIGARRERA